MLNYTSESVTVINPLSYSNTIWTSISNFLYTITPQGQIITEAYFQP